MEKNKFSHTDKIEAELAEQVQILQPLMPVKPITFRSPTLAKLKEMQKREDDAKLMSSPVHSHVIYG